MRAKYGSALSATHSAPSAPVPSTKSRYDDPPSPIWATKGLRCRPPCAVSQPANLCLQCVLQRTVLGRLRGGLSGGTGCHVRHWLLDAMYVAALARLNTRPRDRYARFDVYRCSVDRCDDHLFWLHPQVHGHQGESRKISGSHICLALRLLRGSFCNVRYCIRCLATIVAKTNRLGRLTWT